MPQTGAAAVEIYSDGIFKTPDFSGTSLDPSTWVISWQSFATATPKNTSNAQEFVIPLPEDCPALARHIVNSSIEHLSADFLQQWKIAQLAQALGLSQRTLQRRFGTAGVSFSDLVRALRIHEACQLLEDQGTPLDVVGFCAGFSDSAHFSRDFRATTGTTPSDFREALRDI